VVVLDESHYIKNGTVSKRHRASALDGGSSCCSIHASAGCMVMAAGVGWCCALCCQQSRVSSAAACIHCSAVSSLQGTCATASYGSNPKIHTEKQSALHAPSTMALHCTTLRHDPLQTERAKLAAAHETNPNTPKT
jgi:hypothetical protein